MSADEQLSELIKSPKFQVMVRRRQQVSYLLSFLVVAVYSLFVVLMAYAPASMTAMGWGGEMISSGVVFTVFIIIFSVLLSGIYTWWANNHFDELKKELLAELETTKSAE